MPNPYDQLHAYWRMEYIETPEGLKGKNPFVELPKIENERESLMLFRGNTCYLILNRFPYNAGHILVLPFREVGELENLTAEERTEFFDLIIRGKKILSTALKPDGFNIGMNLGSAAGAGIPVHLHAHIVPRWNGDTNFMPVLGQTRVLPTSLEAMWERLKEISNRLEA
ncbi:MAG: HIT domain-containing protein [Verrucomicrobia bacterium]|nr:HIT domain-containing protein [Verrucomicrobiota bacterium]MDA1065946.1 HIT domain-containing protein [Verrucomicrobiota bacterium]